MINYRLSAAVSVHYVMQTSVQTHIYFVDAPLLISPAVSFHANLFVNVNTTL